MSTKKHSLMVYITDRIYDPKVLSKYDYRDWLLLETERFGISDAKITLDSSHWAPFEIEFKSNEDLLLFKLLGNMDQTLKVGGFEGYIYVKR